MNCPGPSPKPPQDGEPGVQERHGQRQQRHDEGDHRDPLVALEGQERKHVADEERPGVAHEDPGRREVEGQEARQGPEERHPDQDAGDVAAGLPGDHRERGGNDGGDAGGQPVQPVDQVDGVGDQHDPGRRHDPDQPGRELEDAARHRLGHVVDPEAEGEGHAGGRELDKQLGEGGEAPAVVEGPEPQHHETAHVERLQGGQLLLGNQDERRGQAHEEAEGDGEPPHEGHGVAPAHLALVGPVHGLHRERETRDDGRGQGGHGRGQREDGEDVVGEGHVGLRTSPPG